MRVLIDANPLVNNHSRRGIGRTTRCLLEEFARRPPAPGADPNLAYCLREALWQHPSDWPGLRLCRLDDREDILDAAARDGADLLHLMDYFHPLYDPGRLRDGLPLPFRLVVTVRDIVPFHLPDLKRGGLARLKRNLFPLLTRADHIIAVSRWTKHDLVASLKLPPGKISVVHHGVDHGLFHDRYSKEETAETARWYGLGQRYVLYVSAFDSRKNHSLLVDALYYLDRIRPQRLDLALVGPGPVPKALSEQIRRRKLETRTRILSEVPSGDLARLYAGATLFAFPSLYEGFGNPVIEAMASGVPVVALRRSAVPEVAQGAVLLVKENEYGAFAEAMAKALDPNVARDLRLKGRERAAEFTWGRAADLTLGVYRSLLPASSTTTLS